MQPITVNFYFDGDSKRKLSRALGDLGAALTAGLGQAMPASGDVGAVIMRAIRAVPSPAVNDGARDNDDLLDEVARGAARLDKYTETTEAHHAHYEATQKAVLARLGRGEITVREAVGEIADNAAQRYADALERMDKLFAAGEQDHP